MNRSFVTARITFIVFFFVTQQMSGMELMYSYGKQWITKCWYGEKAHVPPFGKFSELPAETQLLIFKHSDNKSNFQKINKEWYKEGSIKSPLFVANEFYSLGDRRMCRIFLNAVWDKNYEGVENILKHYYAKQPNHTCYYSVDIDEATQNQVILDSYEIADEDKEVIQLLQTYKVKYKENEAIIFVASDPLIMACLAGSSDLIVPCLSSLGDTTIKRAINILVDCDHAKCMQKLLNPLQEYFGLHVGDEKRACQTLFNRKLLRRACINKSCKTLTILLSSGHCNINEVVSDVTLLDEMLEVAQQGYDFSSVVSLLQQHRAKTAEQLAKNAEYEEIMFERFKYPCLT